MPLFDSTLLFFHTGNVTNFTSGEFVSLVGMTASSASSVINLGNPRDLGIGPGANIPQVVVLFGTGVTYGASVSQLTNIEFQGSTNSVLWTTYMETGYNATTSLAAGSGFTFDVPRRVGTPLPLYYQLNVTTQGVGTASATAVSTGTIFAGIVLAASENAGTMAQYASGFSVS